MSLLPKLRTKYGEVVGVELFFAFPELQDDQRTYLDADVAAGASSLSANGVNFSTSQYVIIGNPGNLKTEIIQIHTGTTPTSTAITLASSLSFAHSRGDVVRFIPYNQITPERSTNGGTSYSALSAINIRADSTETYLQRTTDSSTDQYIFRFSNSSAGTFSAYSDAVTATGYSDNTIFAVKDRALDELGEQRSNLITDKFLNNSIQEARRALDQDPHVLRWSFRTKFGTVLGQMKSGEWRIAVPTDLRDQNSPKNVLFLTVGNQNRPILYQDRNRFQQNYLNVVHTTVATAYTSGGTSLVLTSTHDLDDSGTIRVANNSIGDGLRTVTYSANNRSTNTLTITSIATNISAATDIWQRATFGLPSAYNISQGYFYFDVPLNTDNDGRDCKTDYYSGIPAIDSDSDQFDEPFYDLYVSWLKWKIKYKKANGKIERDKDADYKDFLDGAARVIGQEFPGQWINFIPDIEGFLSAQE